MPTLTIDRQEIEVGAGSTILDAAGALGIRIPTLCHLDGEPPFTSCMVCMVRDLHSERMLPACSALAQDGMVVATCGPEVTEARRDAIELLLSDHAGDCEGPCERLCPANLDIPRMLRQIAAGQAAAALATVLETIALPAVLGRICPAPCERGCRRAGADTAVAIRLLKRFTADCGDTALALKPEPDGALCDKRVAIVGAGPAGLAAAFYLTRAGCKCTLLDRQAAAGGALRCAVPEARLPHSVLDADIARILASGVEFQPGRILGDSVTLAALRDTFDAVVLTMGATAPATLAAMGLAVTDQGLQVDRHTRQTSLPDVFGGGAVVRPRTDMAVRAVADGRRIAVAAEQYVRGQSVTGLHTSFNSRLGTVTDTELAVLRAAAESAARCDEPGAAEPGLDAATAAREARRCLHCDCRKKTACRLRSCAQEVDARQSRYKDEPRPLFTQRRAGTLVFEPGKCIRCGLCVRITAAAGEKYGLAFMDRGYDVRVDVPFEGALGNALTTTADACVNACPTGALAFEDS